MTWMRETPRDPDWYWYREAGLSRDSPMSVGIFVFLYELIKWSANGVTMKANDVCPGCLEEGVRPPGILTKNRSPEEWECPL